MSFGVPLAAAVQPLQTDRKKPNHTTFSPATQRQREPFSNPGDSGLRQPATGNNANRDNSDDDDDDDDDDDELQQWRDNASHL